MRKEIIEATIAEAVKGEEDKHWIFGYYDILDNTKENEGIGAATRDIVKTIRLKYDQKPITLISIFGIDNLEIAVRMGYSH